MFQPTPNAPDSPIVACPTVPVGASPGQSGWPSWAASVSACDGRAALKFCVALGTLDTPLAASMAVARQNNVPVVGKSAVGMNPVSLTPSGTVLLTSTGENDPVVLMSNLYVMAPAGPERAALAPLSAGRVLVCAPFSGAIGAGGLMTTAGPTENLNVTPNTPVVPALTARACQ